MATHAHVPAELCASLLEAIEALASALHRSGKSDTASFYRTLHRQIESAGPRALRELIGQISSSAKITQFADFSPAEAVLFDVVYDRTEELARALSE